MLTRLRTGRDEGGFSLVELIVVIGIMALVGSIVMSATISGLRASRQTQARVAALNDLVLGLERIGRELRVADPLDLTFITSLDDADTAIAAIIERDGLIWRYHYYLAVDADGDPELRENLDVTNPDGTTNTALSHDSLFIVKTVNVTEDTPLVTYLTEAGTVLECTSGMTVADCRDLLADAAQLRITLIRDLDEGQPVIAQTTVNIRSVRYS